eukprot:8366543-Alexandrium_andersonii.AAC.1
MSAKFWQIKRAGGPEWEELCRAGGKATMAKQSGAQHAFGKRLKRSRGRGRAILAAGPVLPLAAIEDD